MSIAILYWETMMTSAVLFAIAFMITSIGFAYATGRTVAERKKGVAIAITIAILFSAAAGLAFINAGRGQLPRNNDNNGLLSAGSQYEVLTSFEVSGTTNESEHYFAMLIRQPNGRIVSYANTNLPPPVFIYTPDGKSLFTAPAK